MSEEESNNLDKAIDRGTRLALRRLIKQRASENGSLIFSEDGKITKVSALSLLKKKTNKKIS